MKKKLSAIGNQRGIALVMVLILSLISLAIMAGLIYMLTSGTQISGMGKRYKTALEAGKGGKDVTEHIINLKGDPLQIQNFFVSPLFNVTNLDETCSVNPTTDTLSDGTACADHVADCNAWPAGYRGLCVKLTLPTYCWSASCNNSLTINPDDDPASYDMSFVFQGSAAGDYTAYAKIVDTVWGNSSASSEAEFLGGTGVVESASEVSVVSVPFLYTIEIDAQNTANSAERAKLSVMYQF